MGGVGDHGRGRQPGGTGGAVVAFALCLSVVACESREREARDDCCAYCETGVACGDACISTVDDCYASAGCACNGPPPGSDDGSASCPTTHFTCGGPSDPALETCEHCPAGCGVEHTDCSGSADAHGDVVMLCDIWCER